MKYNLVRISVVIFFILFQNVAAIDCEKDCKNIDYTNPNYKPQECVKKCPKVAENTDGKTEKDEHILELEAKVDKILTLVVALLVLIVILILISIFFIIKNSTLSSVLLKSWRKKHPHTNVTITSDKSAARIANYAVQKSPRSYRTPNHETEIPRQTPFSSTPNNVHNCTARVRRASESTCPDDSENVDGAAYDNLALSTSTLGCHTRPSSPESPSPVSNPSPSIATINTTMTTIQMDSGLPERNDASRRTTP